MQQVDCGTVPKTRPAIRCYVPHFKSAELWYVAYARTTGIRHAYNLLQFCKLRPSLPQNRDVGVCVFAEAEKVLVRGAGFGDIS